MKMEAVSHQGIACGQVGHKSRDNISDTDSGRQVQRYIRLTYLIPEFLEKMDKGEIALSVGVELSYLNESRQQDVLEQCKMNDCTPSYSQAWRMHKAEREGLLTKDVIQFVMREYILSAYRHSNFSSTYAEHSGYLELYSYPSFLTSRFFRSQLLAAHSNFEKQDRTTYNSTFIW